MKEHIDRTQKVNNISCSGNKSLSTHISQQALIRNTQTIVQALDHSQAQRAFSIKDFRNSAFAAADICWLTPLVSEKLDLDMTLMTLPIISLIPEEINQEIKAIVGDVYSYLSELDRFILVLAHRFEKIGNADIKLHRNEHPREIGDRLKYLVQQGILAPLGHGRGMRYCLHGKTMPDLFSEMDINSEHYQEKSEHKEVSSEHKEISSEHYALLVSLAESIRNKQRTSPEQLKSVIVQLCADEFLTLRTLAELLNRAPDSIRNHYIKPMLKEGLLEARYPLQHNHPQQAYKTRIEIQ